MFLLITIFIIMTITVLTILLWRHPNRKIKILLTLIITSLTLGIYTYLNNIKGIQALTDLESDRKQITQIAESLNSGEQTPEQAIKTLQSHVQKNPKSIDGWFFLGQVAMEAEQYDTAKQAFIKAKTLAPTDPNVLFGLFEVDYLQAGNEMTSEAQTLAQEILKLDPEHETLRNLLAMEAMKKQDWQQAAGHLHALLPVYPADTEQGKYLREALNKLQTRIKPNSKNNSQAIGTDAIRVNIHLDPKAEASAKKDDLVFIALKRVNGPPMPLRVVRTTVADLSHTIILDAQTAMMNSGPLPTGEPLKITAHISKSGIANRQKGDWMGEMEVGDAAGLVEVVINHQY